MVICVFDCVQSIKRVIDLRTVDLIARFVDELNMVKREFSQQCPVLPMSQARHSGMATWARALKQRIDNPVKVKPSYDGGRFLLFLEVQVCILLALSFSRF